MKKYQLCSLRPKIEGYIYPEPPSDEVKRRLDIAGMVSSGNDNYLGLYVVCERKPEDFPDYGLWWIEIDSIIDELE